MNRHTVKYLALPVVTSLIDIVFQTLYLVTTSKTEHLPFLLFHMVCSIPLTIPSIFVPTLIFAVAYKLTHLNIKTLSYAVIICLVPYSTLPFTKAFFHYVNTLTISIQYLVVVHDLYFTLNYFVNLLLIAGVSYLYGRITKRTIAPLSNKLIALLYSGLVIAFFLTQTYIIILYSLGFNTPSTLVMIPLVISWTIYFIYCYEWSKRIIDSTINTTNYPIKIILSSILSTFAIVTISMLLNLVLGLLMLLAKSTNTLTLFLTLCALLGYILAIPVFIKIQWLSNATTYFWLHTAFYTLVPIAIIINLIIYLANNYRFDYSHLALSILSCYGILLLTLSILLSLTYIFNKIAIRFIFKTLNPPYPRATIKA